LEVFFHPEARSIVVIAWRVPASIEKQVNLDKWASLVAECVTAEKPGP
jgi:hypothetical protein